jgi:hypothetical protein
LSAWFSRYSEPVVGPSVERRIGDTVKGPVLREKRGRWSP